mmetsp:Transcript_104289/g.325246  ORF Transcript_104289/g.325246 Transcript_104289/m.325246 type:complete len:239 (-) Transcript_104289:78-794(-)
MQARNASHHGVQGVHPREEVEAAAEGGHDGAEPHVLGEGRQRASLPGRVVAPSQHKLGVGARLHDERHEIQHRLQRQGLHSAAGDWGGHRCAVRQAVPEGVGRKDLRLLETVRPETQLLHRLQHAGGARLADGGDHELQGRRVVDLGVPSGATHRQFPPPTCKSASSPSPHEEDLVEGEDVAGRKHREQPPHAPGPQSAVGKATRLQSRRAPQLRADQGRSGPGQGRAGRGRGGAAPR